MKLKTAINQPYEPIIGNFKDQKVVVLGGASGIGLAIVEAFYQQGAHVVALGMTPLPKELSNRDSDEAQSYILKQTQNIIESMPDVGGKYPLYSPGFVECDVTKQRGKNLEVVELLDGIGKKNKKMDVMVDSIGWSPRKPLEELTHEEVGVVASTNSHYLPIMLQSVKHWLKGTGRVIVIGSTLPHGLTDTTAMAYGMAKASRLTAALSLARDFGHDGINICVVSPSHVQTPNERSILGEAADEALKRAKASRLNGIDVTPADIAAYVLTAASNRIAPLITGRELMLGSSKGSPLNEALSFMEKSRATQDANTIGDVLLSSIQQQLDMIARISEEKSSLSSQVDALTAMLNKHGIDPETGLVRKAGTVVSLVHGAPHGPQ